MLRTFIFPIMVSLSCLLLQVFFSRSRGMPTGDHPEFRFPVGLRIFCWVGIFAVTVLPMILPPWHAGRVTLSSVLFGIEAIFGFACCVWADKFVLKFWDDHLTYGAFKLRNVYYADIISSGIRMGGGGKRFLVIKTATKRIAISGYLGSLEDAATLLESKLNGFPRGR
jgi:hypothetical protein